MARRMCDPLESMITGDAGAIDLRTAIDRVNVVIESPPRAGWDCGRVANRPGIAQQRRSTQRGRKLATSHPRAAPTDRSNVAYRCIPVRDAARATVCCRCAAEWRVAGATTDPAGGQLVEPGRLAGAARRTVGAVHHVRQQRRPSQAASGLRRLRVARQREHLRLPVCRRRRQSTEACGVVLLRHEATAGITRPGRRAVFSDSGRRDLAAALDRGGAPGSSDPGGDGTCSSSIAITGISTSLRPPLNGISGPPLRRVLRSECDTRRPGCGRPPMPGLAILPGLVRYDSARPDDPPRFFASRALDQRLRLSRIASRWQQLTSAADGRAPAAEGEQGPLAVHAGGAKDFPRDAASRPDRRRQRVGHVCERRVRSALEQRRPEPARAR